MQMAMLEMCHFHCLEMLTRYWKYYVRGFVRACNSLKVMIQNPIYFINCKRGYTVTESLNSLQHFRKPHTLKVLPNLETSVKTTLNTQPQSQSMFKLILFRAYCKKYAFQFPVLYCCDLKTCFSVSVLVCFDCFMTCALLCNEQCVTI